MNTETIGINNLESEAEPTVDAEISRVRANSTEDDQGLGISDKGTVVDLGLGHDEKIEGNGWHTSNSNCSKDDNTLALTELPQSIKQSEFHVNDLIWAKVRNYPWWPGQVFDPSDASENAKKYQNRYGLLIGFFSDQTFAWNEVSRVKPFHSNFSRMEKHSESESFLNAVGSALDEVSRRVQFGLSCRCYPVELLDKIRTQIVVNAGIREESSRREFGGNNHSSVTSFVPVNLVSYVKQLAENPRKRIERLDFAMAHAQLLAFNRWKGYYELPELKVSDGLFLDNVDVDDDDDDELIITSYKKLKSIPSQKKPYRRQIESKPNRKSSSSPPASSLIKKHKMSESDSSSKKQLSRVGESMCRVATLLVRDNPSGSNERSSKKLKKVHDS